MANLTTSRDIVRQVPDTNPVPGFQLVVFTRYGDGGGRKFRATLEPGQRFVPTVWEKLLPRGDGYIAWGVTCDRHLRERFTRAVTKAGELGPLTLHLTLKFFVSDAQLVVDTLDSDPLQRLVDEIGDLLEAATLRFDWTLLGGPDDGLDQELQKAFLQGAREIKTLAGALGFEVRAFQAGHALSPELDEHLRARRQAEVDTKVLEAKQTVERVRAELGGELERMLASQKASIATIAAMRDLSTGAIDSLQTVLRQIAAGVNSPAALNAVLGELGETLQKIRATALGAGTEAGPLPSGLPAAPAQFTVDATVRRSPLETQVTRALEILGPLDGDATLRTRLFSRIFRLFGELAAGDVAAAQRHATALDEDELRGELMVAVRKQQQREYLESLQDVPKLRATLHEVCA
jgi:hypothetical protein